MEADVAHYLRAEWIDGSVEYTFKWLWDATCRYNNAAQGSHAGLPQQESP